MKAFELQEGRHFRVVGLPDVWVVLDVLSASVRVRPVTPILVKFTTGDGLDVAISVRPKPFYISRETSVEVDQ